MSQNSNVTMSEIDEIIARAMAEYASVRGTAVFNETPVSQEETPPVTQEEELPPVEGEIPVNSESILVEETTSRFSSAAWFNNVQAKIVTLAGIGGIGSYVAFLLSRLHIRSLYLYDDDRVELANLSGQLYSRSSIGRTKVDAMCTTLGEFSDYYDYMAIPERFTEESSATPIMICGFDNMSARKTFFNKWKALRDQATPEDLKTMLFIDGRLAAEEFQVLCLRGDDDYNIAKYEKDYLFDDSEAMETLCSYKQTTFMANMIGSIIVNLFVNFCANECDPLIPRDMPFLTEYNAETMFFKVTN